MDGLTLEFSQILLTPLHKKNNGRDLFKLAEDLEVRLCGDEFITIPKGFVTDGASIPRPVRWKWTSWGRYAGPAILHDYMLAHTNTPKWLIDVVFYIALRFEGVSALEAALFWMSVRMKRSKD